MISSARATRRPAKDEEGSRQTILLARRTRTMKRCSSDARSEGQSGDSLGREGLMMQRRKQEALARANGTLSACQWVRRVRKLLRARTRIRAVVQRNRQ